MTGAPALVIERPGDASAFEDLAGPFLCAREAENNLLLGISSVLRAGGAFGVQRPFFAVVRDGRVVVGAALRTPPHNLVLAAGTSEAAIPLILDRLAAETGELAGVIGPKDVARRAADDWARRTGAAPRLVMAQRIYRLARVVPPRPVAGAMRPARRADLERLAPWFLAFLREAQPHLAGTAEDARANAERWVESGRLRVWEDGEVVSMAGASGPTPRGIRVSAVYTPPAKRGRGYASALVAALSREQLDAGRTFCFLFTDLANPTSNRVYVDIGYEPVADVDEYRFD